METVGFIGIGTMGIRMAARLLQAGYPLRAYDVLPEALSNVEALGAVACYSPREAAQGSDVMITIVPNSNDVEDAVLGTGGIIEGTHPGQIYIDMSSASPSSTRKIASALEERGVNMLDAPVSGGVSGATAGTLTIMIGADDATFDKVKPVFDVLGKNIYHVGEVGGGDAIKMVNNLLLGCNMAALAEALTLGVKCGLSVETMKEVISVSSGRSYAMDAKLEKFIMADQFTGGFAVDLQYKDLGLALEASRDEKVPLPMTAAAVQIYEAARAKGQGREDMSSVVKVWEDLTGAQIRGTGK